jgi:hypothetical protein
MTRSPRWPWVLVVGLLAEAPAGCGGRIGDVRRRSSSDAGALGVGGSLEDGLSNAGQPDAGHGGSATSTGGVPSTGGTSVVPSGGVTATGGAPSVTTGDAFTGGSGAVEYCSGEVRESGRVPSGIGVPGAPDPCVPNPCERGAVCVAHRGRALCDCDTGTFGDRCELATRAIASDWWSNYCAILMDGSLRCWGVEYLRTPPSGTFTAVSVSPTRSCAISTFGELVCWDENMSTRSVPLGNFVAVALGAVQGCAIRTDGDLVCWDESGVVPAPEGTFIDVALAADVACGIREDQTLTCWGGEFAGGASPPEGMFVAVEVADGYACALGTDSHAVCWGLLPSRCLGCPSPDISLQTPTTPFASISLSGDGACGIRMDGFMECWGDATALDGQYVEVAGDCGLRRDGSFTCAEGRPPGDWVFTAVDVSFRTACALRANRTLVCWKSVWERGQRDNFDEYEGAFRSISVGGQTCALSTDGAPSYWSESEDQPSFEESLLAVAVGTRHTCAIRGNCTLTCGADLDDEHGAAIPPGGGFTAIACGEDFSCGIRDDGTLACWGLDDADQSSPPSGVFVAVAAGYRHACGIRTDGALTCWGEDIKGSASPPKGTFEAIATKGTYNCAIRTDGTVACWGICLSMGAPPDGPFTAIAAGCGVTRDDLRVSCWCAHL